MDAIDVLLNVALFVFGVGFYISALVVGPVLALAVIELGSRLFARLRRT